MNPAQENHNPQDSTALERYLALKQIREYMFLNDPETFGYTDIAEDLPGAAKPIGHVLHNVLPSATIISQDEDKRKAQIDAAIQRIKNTKKSDSELRQEMLHSAASMAKSSILPGMLLAGLFGKFGLRLPRKAGKWVAPLEMSRIKALFSASRKGAGARKILGKELFTNALSSAGYAATAGALTPYIASKTSISDKSLEDARKIMEEHPYMTSLPATELMSAIQNTKDPQDHSAMHKLKNIGTGAGLGAVTGAAGALVPTALTSALSILTRGKLGPKGGITSAANIKKLMNDVKMNTALNAGLGGVMAVGADNPIQNEYEHIKNSVREYDDKHQRTSNSTQAANAPKESISYTI
jgi:hypothetical protein